MPREGSKAGNGNLLTEHDVVNDAVNPDSVSKVVDENGEPMAMYHGTDAQFNVFKNPQLGFHFGSYQQAAFVAAKKSGGQVDAYFLNSKSPRMSPDLVLWDKEAGRLLTGEMVDYSKEGKPERREIIAQLQKVFPDIPTPPPYNPDNFKARNDWVERVNNWARMQDQKSLRDALLQIGRDGIIYPNRFEGAGLSWMVFSPSQIKSATANNGNYDSTDDNTLHSVTTKQNLLNPQVSSASTQSAQPSGKMGSGDMRLIIHEALGFNPDSVSKVVDENGEPIVMYHGTNARCQHSPSLPP